MYEDAIKTSGNADRIQLCEISELTDEAVFGTERSDAPTASLM